jgi:hypothetical protein
MHFPNFMVFLFCVLEITVDFIDEIHPGMTGQVCFSRIPLMILTSQTHPEAEGEAAAYSARAHPPAA